MIEEHFRFAAFVPFHLEELPGLLEARAPLTEPVMAGLRPLAIVVGDGAFTYRPSPEGPRIERGVGDGARVVELTDQQWRDFASQRHTSFGLLYRGEAKGRLDHLVAWEPALRALYQGRPIYTPEAVDLTGLDLDRELTAADPLADIVAFLDRTGFVRVRGVFDPGEVAAMGREVERLVALARPGDDRSWWAGHAHGHDVCCRLTFVNERSELFERLHDEPRLAHLVAAATPPGVTTCGQTDRHDGNTVVIKPAGTVSGLADLPWHVDCGLGGHPVMCPGFNVGIQLDTATAETGQLELLVGSHRATAVHLPAELLATADYPTVALTTEPGDVTVHFTDTLHRAPAPTGAGGRRVLYASWKNAAALDVVPAGQGYNDVVLRSDPDNRVRNLAGDPA